MIYEFVITETSKAIIPVRANDSYKAQQIFEEWYKKHDDELDDGYITELLDNGYEGREISRKAGISDDVYLCLHPGNPVMLPEESRTPEEPKYDLDIRFAGTGEHMKFSRLTLGQIGLEMSRLSDEYYLQPDICDDKTHTFLDVIHLKNEETTYVIRLYAVPK